MPAPSAIGALSAWPLHPKVMPAADSLVPPGGEPEGGCLSVAPAKRVGALARGELEILEYSAAHWASLKERHVAFSWRSQAQL